MKLKDVLNEYSSKFPAYAGTWGPIGYKATPGNMVDPVSQGADEYVEDHLIDQTIDFIYRDYPELVQKKKIKRHLKWKLIVPFENGVKEIINRYSKLEKCDLMG